MCPKKWLQESARQRSLEDTSHNPERRKKRQSPLEKCAECAKWCETALGAPSEVLERSRSRPWTAGPRRLRSHLDVHSVCKLITVTQGWLSDVVDPCSSASRPDNVSCGRQQTNRAGAR